MKINFFIEIIVFPKEKQRIPIAAEQKTLKNQMKTNFLMPGLKGLHPRGIINES